MRPVLFVEAPESVEQIGVIARTLPGPKLINMFHGGKTPLVPFDMLVSRCDHPVGPAARRYPGDAEDSVRATARR